MRLRTRSIAILVCAFSVVVLMASPAFANAGDLDAAFGGDGKVTTNFTSGEDRASGVAIQADRKIVVAGYAGGSGGRFALARYKPNGHLDPTFGGDGKVTTNFTAQSDIAEGVAIQTDGKIVAAGQANGNGGRFALARYEPNGHLDPTFGGDGKVTTNFAGGGTALAVAIQADGMIVVAGHAAFDKFAVTRYGTDGDLDPSFGGDGKVTTDFTNTEDTATSLSIQGDGKIVVAGHAAFAWFALARYETDGNLDPTFGVDGKVTTDFTAHGVDVALDLTTQDDGKIVAAGEAGASNPKFALARYETDGDLDPTFGGDGKVTTDFLARNDALDIASSVAAQVDGKIVAGGDTGTATPRFALARYNADGRLDPSFGGNGKVAAVHGSDPDVAIQANGKIVAAGFTSGRGGQWAVARYLGS